jgi:NADH/NAD ratio-sensing transcriptional regulator Rex
MQKLKLSNKPFQIENYHKMSNNKTSRRKFVKKTLTASAAISIIPRHVMGGINFTAPSDQLTKAVIGVGGMGQGHLNYEGTKLLAICDVDQNHLSTTLEKNGSSVKDYRDFREVLQRPDIDIIHIATPPHWHSIMAIMAAEAGKDVWCEKPMTRTIS